jgi:hypothetical protein
LPLDTVIGAFQDGATAEEIAQQYPSATLGVVYQVIGYGELRPTSRRYTGAERVALAAACAGSRTGTALAPTSGADCRLRSEASPPAQAEGWCERRIMNTP